MNYVCRIIKILVVQLFDIIIGNVQIYTSRLLIKILTSSFIIKTIQYTSFSGSQASRIFNISRLREQQYLQIYLYLNQSLCLRLDYRELLLCCVLTEFFSSVVIFQCTCGMHIKNIYIVSRESMAPKIKNLCNGTLFRHFTFNYLLFIYITNRNHKQLIYLPNMGSGPK